MSSPTLPTALNVPEKAKFAKASLASPVESAVAECPRTSRRVQTVVFVVLAVGGVALDLVSKQLIFAWRGWERLGEVSWLFPGVFGVETSTNPGALFGMGAGYRAIFIGLSFAALAAIGYVVFVRRAAIDLALTTALGLVTGGILGNLYDRLGLWHTSLVPDSELYGVRDWIHFRLQGVPLCDPWPNFNIADCCLVVGACMLALHSLFAEGDAARAKTSEKG